MTEKEKRVVVDIRTLRGREGAAGVDGGRGGQN